MLLSFEVSLFFLAGVGGGGGQLKGREGGLVNKSDLKTGCLIELLWYLKSSNSAINQYFHLSTNCQI